MKPKTTIKLGAGTGSRWTGWQKRIADAVDQLAADAEGVALRLKHPARPGIPAAYRAQRVFEPETSTQLLDTEQDGTSSNLVNYVVRDAKAYDIPCKFTGDGVFVVNRVKVAVTQRVFVTPYGAAVDIPCPVLQNGFANHQTVVLVNAVAWTTKFSIFPKQPECIISGSLAAESVLYGAVNFFWNMRDDRTGRYLASDNMPCTDLQPGYVAPAQFENTTIRSRVPISDGGFYEMACPWMFERDGQATFRFFPVSPIFQFDSSLAGTDAAVGLTYDDRENNIRRQPVTVAVEYHGYRYRTDQDAMRAGALTRY